MLWTKNLSKKIYHGQTYVLRLFFFLFQQNWKIIRYKLEKKKNIAEITQLKQLMQIYTSWVQI